MLIQFVCLLLRIKMSSESDYYDSGSETPGPSKKRKMDKTNWRQQAFSESWLEDKNFEGWIAAVPNDKFKVRCKPCNKTLIAGKSELLKHSKTALHYKSARAAHTSKQLTNFIAKTVDNDQIDAELRLSLMTVKYNLSFRSMEGIIDTVKHVFRENKLSKAVKMKRTKCISIINNVISKALSSACDNTLKLNFFSILVDESTDISNNKHLCILVMFLKQNEKQVHLLDLINVNESATAESMYTSFTNCLKKHNLDTKNIVGYCSDNANVMMGRNDSFMTNLLKDNDGIFVLGCICHSAHLIASHAADELPKNLEGLMHSLYSYFSRSPKRQALLEGIQKTMNKEKRKLINPSRTRWLALLNSVNRILDQWTILQNTFLLASLEDRSQQAQIILNDLNNMYTKAYFEFMQHILPCFQNFNLLFQSDKNLIGNLYVECTRFLRILASNFVKYEYLSSVETCDINDPVVLLPLHEINIGVKAVATLSELSNKTHTIEFRSRCLKFYQTAMREALQRLPFQNDFIMECQFILPKTVLRKTNRINIKNICAKYSTTLNTDLTLSEYKMLPFYFSEDEISNIADLTIENFWHHISEIRDISNKLVFENISKLSKIVLSLPHSNASVERIFSVYSDIKTKKRNKLSTKTLSSIIRIKLEMNLSKTTPTTFKITDTMRSLFNSNMYADSSSSDQEVLNSDFSEEN